MRAKTQTQSHFTILLRKLPEPCPHVPKKHRAQSLSPRTVCHLNSPSAAALPGVSCLSQLLGCISTDPMIPTPLLWSLCSSINVTLGAHNIKQQERTQQVIRVRTAISHPDYNPKTLSNDIMLLKVNRPASHALLGSARFPSQDLLPLSSFSSWLPDPSLWLRREGRHISVIAVSRLRDHWLSQTLVSSHSWRERPSRHQL